MQNKPITFQHSTNRHKILQKDYIFKHCNNFPNETIFIILKENKKNPMKLSSGKTIKTPEEAIFRWKQKLKHKKFPGNCFHGKQTEIRSSEKRTGPQRKKRAAHDLGQKSLDLPWFFSLSFSELFAFVYYKVFGRV